MITILQSPLDQIAEARWWATEFSLGLPRRMTSPNSLPGCSCDLVRKVRRHLAELVVKHVRGQLESREIVVDETIPF
jgi:hypothetical protein